MVFEHRLMILVNYFKILIDIVDLNYKMKDFLEDVIEGEEQKNKKVDPYVYVTP